MCSSNTRRRTPKTSSCAFRFTTADRTRHHTEAAHPFPERPPLRVLEALVFVASGRCEGILRALCARVPDRRSPPGSPSRVGPAAVGLTVLRHHAGALAARAGE